MNVFKCCYMAFAGFLFVPFSQAQPVVEWAPFTLKEGVNESQLLAAAENVQRVFLASQPGFQRRELLQGANRQWVDLVYWQDEKSAESAAQAAMNSGICLQYFSMMQEMDNPQTAEPPAHYRQRQNWRND